MWHEQILQLEFCNVLFQVMVVPESHGAAPLSGYLNRGKAEVLK